MKEKKINSILKKRVNKIIGLCRNIDKDFDKEAIHNFRVSVKALRSLLRLLRIIHKPSLKIPKKFKRLYHIAGAIRDTQLEIDTISRKLPGMPLYNEKLHRMLDRQKKEWEKYYSKKTLRKFADKIKAVNYEGLHPEILNKFFDDRMTDVQIIVQRRTPSDGQIHNVRKKIKDILYTAELGEKEWAGIHKQINSLPVKQLDGLANLIGAYHDKRQMLGHLSAFSSPKMKQEEKETIGDLHNNETRKLTALKKRIMITAMKLVAKNKAG